MVSVAAGFKAAALKEESTGVIAPAEQDGNRLVFFARELPPMGYRTYVPVDRVAEAPDGRQRAGGNT